MAWSFTDNNAIRYVLPVLWMTSCFHVLGQIRIQAIGELFTVTRQVAPGAKSAILELPCYHQMRVFISCAPVNKI